jgi:Zn ribbon nucleic-acid-binding protein
MGIVVEAFAGFCNGMDVTVLWRERSAEPVAAHPCGSQESGDKAIATTMRP